METEMEPTTSLTEAAGKDQTEAFWNDIKSVDRSKIESHKLKVKLMGSDDQSADLRPTAVKAEVKSTATDYKIEAKGEIMSEEQEGN